MRELPKKKQAVKLSKRFFKQHGKAGGHKAARESTPEQRSERARKAALARWAKTKGSKPEKPKKP
jgi:hypothetical protein